MNDLEKQVVEVSGTQIEGWIMVTCDWTGLGWAMMLQDNNASRGYPRDKRKPNKVICAVIPKEGEEKMKELNKVGKGIVERQRFDDLFKEREKYKKWVWLWDCNHNPEFSDQLRKEGFMVFGGNSLMDKMEHDREFGLSLIKRAGMPVLPYESFENVKDGLDYMDKNPDIVYVFKPDEGSAKDGWITMSSSIDNDQAARQEMYDFLKSRKDGNGSFVLQERKKGVEINVEVWLYKGTPFFAIADFECKRKYNGDGGKMIGCAQDVAFVIPLDCKIVNDTLMKLVKLPEYKTYTGFVDMNLIVCDNEYYFLEFCGRFGYNMHPTIFLGCGLDSLSDIFSDWMLGETDDFGRHFRKGFGASVTCWIDDPSMGLPIAFDDERENESRFYHFDSYKEDDKWFMAGYGDGEVGIAVSHDYDIKSSAENALERAQQVRYPMWSARTDLAETGYLSNPIERYEACRIMGLFESK